MVSIAFDPSSTLAATGSSDGHVRVWDVLKGYATHVFRGSQGVVGQLAFHPDLKALKLFSAADDNKIRIWDLTTSKPDGVLDGHVSTIRGFALRDEMLFSAGRDRVVNAYNWRTKTLIKTLLAYETLEGVALCPAGATGSKKTGTHRLATVGERGQVRVWDFPSGTCIEEHPVGKPLTFITFDTCVTRFAVLLFCHSAFVGWGVFDKGFRAIFLLQRLTTPFTFLKTQR